MTALQIADKASSGREAIITGVKAYLLEPINRDTQARTPVENIAALFEAVKEINGIKVNRLFQKELKAGWMINPGT